VEPPPLSGRVITRSNVVCELGAYGLRVRVSYATTIEDSRDEAATITRVRVYMDGSLRDDSGPLAHKTYSREVNIDGLSRRRHTVQLRIDTWAAPKPGDIIQFAVCPPVPSGPVG
jgi:hypothetical protein